jgi:NADH:ubiquinone oxidoreductase subunit 4 (subunit M)
MNLLSYNIYIYFIISFFFLIFLPIFFIKLYLSITSGISVKNKINNKNLFLDLSKKEFFILILPVFLNLIFGFLPNILI